MSLSEHSLNAGVVRKVILSCTLFLSLIFSLSLSPPPICLLSSIQNGVKVFEGTPLPVFSEADVFKYLGVDYLEPHDRDLD